MVTIIPHFEHKNCDRHIYPSLHKMYKGDEMKLLFWNTSRAYNATHFKQAIEDIKLASSKVIEDFLAQNPRSFYRAFTRTTSKCDNVVNNMAKTFKAYIVHTRSKHLLYILKDIRMALMERMVIKKGTIWTSAHEICPRIRSKLEKKKEESRNCFLVPSSNMVFQVSHRLNQLHVDMNACSCTCRK